ncbi:hypothetical protein JY651_21520 [Pyxidicoccus parkwayensis]|uniref:Lipoprotein n=2 Tax=Pyxidicoccus parkwayensis TaxID=2813578 RepID=A0ABX7PCW3_9BACT|nr:hypothetical protein JY651_21520 [Pyxidicoccus parkwaysis]
MRPSLKKSSLAVLFTTALLAGCGGAPQEGSEQQPSQTGEVSSPLYPDCDPAYYCSVPSQYVGCFDGMIMYAWATPDGGYCIERGVCASHGGPTVCPFE